MIKKYKLVLLIIGTILVLSSCVRNTDYQFMQPYENIVKVELIKVGETKNTNNKPLDQILPEFIVIKELPDSEYANFVNDLKNISFNRYYTDPGYMFTGEEAIKIIYTNGDFELINDGAQATYKNEKYSRTGYYCMEEEDYNKLKLRYFLD